MKILIADDNQDIVEMVSRFLSGHGYQLCAAYNGRDALLKVREEKPDLIVLDILMPLINGYEVCSRLRNTAETSVIPIIILSEKTSIDDKINGITLGADDYLPKPFDLRELKARIEGIVKRNRTYLLLNPLTRLPGNISIEEETKKRIENHEMFAFAYIDIDNFKAYNDIYGYKKGDDVITCTAAIIFNVIKTHGREDDFIGHIGGDDFIVISRPEKIDAIYANIIKEFDQRASGFYRQEDREQGHIVTRDRRGNINTFPLMTLSIGMATNEKRRLEHYAKVVEIAAEMKRFVKTRSNKNNSSYAKDRRSDAP